MRKQCVPGSFLPAHAREPGNEARTIVAGRQNDRSSGAYRPYAFDLITSCKQNVKRIVDGNPHTTSGKNDRGLWSLSTAKQFAKSFLASAGSDFTLTTRMCKASTGPNSHRSE